MTKKKNAQDSTTRNDRASKTRDTVLLARLKRLEERVVVLERLAAKAIGYAK